MKYSEIKEAVKEYSILNPKRVYVEIIALGVFAWIAFIHAVLNENLLSLIISSILMYRGHSLIHEVSHLRNILNYYEGLYDFFFGFPNRIPAYSIRTHRFHHGVNSFGTIKDPEYEKWTDKPALFLLRPALLCNLYPLFLTLRFGVWPIISLIAPKNWSDYVYLRMSSFVMNLNYERPRNIQEEQEVKRSDLLMSAFLFSSLLTAYSFGVLMTFILYWYAMAVVLFLFNTYRALVAHRYLAHRKEEDSSIDGQLLDSVTIEGNYFTELWAPNGLRYHSTHHYLPNIPYYNLGKVHRKLKQLLPNDHLYHITVEPDFKSAFSKLMKSCS
jgi:fatty acid desaturase